MSKPRAIGTLTLGVSLVISGLLFLINTIYYLIPYENLFFFWPIVLILLGGEVLFSYIRNHEQKPPYSGVSIFLLALLVLFSLGVGWVGYFFHNYARLAEIFNIAI